MQRLHWKTPSNSIKTMKPLWRGKFIGILYFILKLNHKGKKMSITVAFRIGILKKLYLPLFPIIDKPG